MPSLVIGRYLCFSAIQLTPLMVGHSINHASGSGMPFVQEKAMTSPEPRTSAESRKNLLKEKKYIYIYRKNVLRKEQVDDAL